MRCPPCPVQQVQQELKLSLNQETACELRLLGFPHLGLCFVDPLLTQHESTEPIPPSAAQKVMSFMSPGVKNSLLMPTDHDTTAQICIMPQASMLSWPTHPQSSAVSPNRPRQIWSSAIPNWQTDDIFLRVWNSFFLTLTARPWSAQGLPFGLGKSESKHPPPERPPKQVTDSRFPSCAARFQTRTNSTPWRKRRKPKRFGARWTLSLLLHINNFCTSSLDVKRCEASNIWNM